MQYIIMAGRSKKSDTKTTSDVPKQLWEVGGEPIIARTIRLLRECGIKKKDIAISTNDDRFKQFGLKILRHENQGDWVNGFYPTDKPTCYIFGDVVFSKAAVQTIVDTDTDSVEFFASRPPFHPSYSKPWAEPFAFKVRDTAYFRECIDTVRQGIADKAWKRDPIAWELWQVVKQTEWNRIDYNNYVAINDYTCDVDCETDLQNFQNLPRTDAKPAKEEKAGPHYMIHACPKRMWYVKGFLVPSMLKQGIKKEQITIYIDDEHKGNLRACAEAFMSVPDDDRGTWHLQDDVLICRAFKERTERYDSGFRAGFISIRYDKTTNVGVVPMRSMPWSFPCIRIPNKIARDCGKWIVEQLIGNPVYHEYTKGGNGDDWAFKLYAQTYLSDRAMHNITPSLVDL